MAAGPDRAQPTTLDDAERKKFPACGAAQPAVRRAADGDRTTLNDVMAAAFNEISLLIDAEQARVALRGYAVGNQGGGGGVEPGVTKTMRPTPAIGAQRGESETSPRPDLEPIFTELAARWTGDGRAVPGRPDEEWTVLARYPWPGH
ncbi:hypothetical protein [Streptomyces parvus]|nr:hypothetical protein [Streptomyces parvus]